MSKDKNTGKKDFENKIQLLHNKVIKNTTTITSDELNYPFLLHIAKIKFKELTPNISRKAGVNEDNTVPRVHCSVNLLGCIIGYAELIFDTLDMDIYYKEDRTLFKGGYYVYTIPFTYALKPNSKLVYDSLESNEHWLVTYNQHTKTYKPNFVDKMFITNMNVIPDINNSKSWVCTIYLSVSNILPITKDIVLNKGYYSLEIKFINNKVKYEVLGYKTIDKTEFEKERIVRTDMLSFKEPKFLNW